MGRVRSARSPAEFRRIAHPVPDEPARRCFGSHSRPRIAPTFLRFTASLESRYPRRLFLHAERTRSGLQTIGQSTSKLSGELQGVVPRGDACL